MTKADPTSDNDGSSVVKEDESQEGKLAQTKVQEGPTSPKETKIVVGPTTKSANATLQPSVSNLPAEEKNRKVDEEKVDVNVEVKVEEEVRDSQKTINVGTRKKTTEEETRDDDETKQTSKQGGSSSKAITTSNVNRSADQTSFTFISPRDRLFGLSSEVHTFNTGLLEKTSDGILKAAKIGDLPALKELHEKGYSLLSIDTTGQTALHLASRYGHKNIIRYLIACAPPTILDIVDNDKGQTALHKAAQHKKRTICCMLVAGGATLTVKDRHGHTPRQLALIAEDRELAAYLQSQEQFQLVVEEQ